MRQAGIQSFEGAFVHELTIRPTAKYVLLRAIVTGLVFLAIETFYFVSWREKPELKYLPVFAPIIFLPVGLRALRRQFEVVTIAGDRLRYEAGFASKSTRTIQLSKIQDVRVDQRPMQRLFGVGNISIETAGEASRLSIPDVDNPQATADEILNRAQSFAR
jgi:membrane protein YdbS with pleckstrin-like domain